MTSKQRFTVICHIAVYALGGSVAIFGPQNWFTYLNATWASVNILAAAYQYQQYVRANRPVLTSWPAYVVAESENPYLPPGWWMDITDQIVEPEPIKASIDPRTATGIVIHNNRRYRPHTQPWCSHADCVAKGVSCIS